MKNRLNEVLGIANEIRFSSNNKIFGKKSIQRNPVMANKFRQFPGLFRSSEVPQYRAISLVMNDSDWSSASPNQIIMFVITGFDQSAKVLYLFPKSCCELYWAWKKRLLQNYLISVREHESHISTNVDKECVWPYAERMYEPWITIYFHPNDISHNKLTSESWYLARVNSGKF